MAHMLLIAYSLPHLWQLLSYGGNIELTLSVAGSLALPEIILVSGSTTVTAQLSPAPTNMTQTYSVVLAEVREIRITLAQGKG